MDRPEILYPYPCRICGGAIATKQDAHFHSAYWTSFKFPICNNHTSDERREYQRNEAYECQVIDADCNDCKHFNRGYRALNHGETTKTEDGNIYTKILVAHDIFHGFCQKLHRPVMAFVNMATGHDCFEHRRTLK